MDTARPEITLVKHPLLLRPDLREVRAITYRRGLTVAELIEPVRLEYARQGFNDIVVNRNGNLLSDLTAEVSPNDFIAVSVYHGGDAFRIIAMIGLMVLAFAVAPYLAPAFTAMGMGTTMATNLAGGLVMLGGGLIINTFLAPPVPDLKGSDSSPTYSWSGYANNTRPGNPVPVAIGHCCTPPQVIGSYREVDSDHKMWQYLLMACSSGQTNNPVTDSRIWVGDEKLISYADTTGYTFGATSGALTIDQAARSALAPFAKIHHDRIFQKGLPCSNNPVATLILHLNGTEGSTLISDTSGRGAPWSCRGNAHLTTQGPTFGTACLKCDTATDTAISDDLEAMRLVGDWEVEGRLTKTAAGDTGFFGQQAVDGQYVYRYGLFEKDGHIRFQAYRGHTYQGEDNAWYTDWTVEADVYDSLAMPVGVAKYVRIQKKGKKIQILAEVAGALSLIAAVDRGRVAYPRYPESDEPIDYPDLTQTLKDAYSQQIGCAYYLNVENGYLDTGVVGTDEAVSQLGGKFKVDELRFTRGLAHKWDNRAIPTAPFPDADPDNADDPDAILTESKCDSVRLLFHWPQGCYEVNEEEGGTDAMTIRFEISYRAKEDSNWTVLPELKYRLNRRESWHEQYQVDFPVLPVHYPDPPVRHYYYVKIRRLTPDDPDDSSHFSQMTECQLAGFDEIINISPYPCYPGMQIVCLGFKADQKISGQIPAIRVEHLRTSLVGDSRVPTWDGTGVMEVDPRNPMWAAYYAMTDTISGRGISPTRFIRPAWEEWAAWCAEEVIPQSGIPRASFDGIFDEVGNLRDNGLNHIEAVGRARVIPVGSNWTVIIDKPRSAQYCFSSGNIKPGSFRWETYEESEKTDAIEVVFWDRKRAFKKRSIIAKSSKYESLDRPPKQTTLQLRGCNDEEQAWRNATFRMQKTEMIQRHGKLTCGLEAAQCEIGDVVHIIHPRHSFMFGGRLRQDHVNSGWIYLDQTITLPAALYSFDLKIFLIDPDGVERIFAVTGPFDTPTSAVQIDGTYTGYRFDTFGMGRTNHEKFEYQVSNMTLTMDQEVEIDFDEYVNEMYFHEKYGSLPI